MEQRAIYVMTHDSIGLGEDGPTHQPVEHVASLRAIPNLNLFRPADVVETAEAWQLALQSRSTPSRWRFHVRACHRCGWMILKKTALHAAAISCAK